jgi:nucleoside-diphosphate-sugar epimerase
MRQYLSLQIALRLLADVLVVNSGLFIGVAARVVGVVVFVIMRQSGPVTADDLRRSVFVMWEFYWNGAPLLTAVCLTVFALSGFYTRGRFYQSRYKAVVIVQAVTLAYLIFGFVTYFVPVFIPHPRTALAIGWLLTAGTLVGGRLWVDLWPRFAGSGAQAAHNPGAAERRILVIGGAGYIGSVLCRQLLEKSYRVRVLDLLLYDDKSIQPLLASPSFEFVKGDSRDIEAVIRAMWDVDSVIHLGEIVGDPATALDSLLTQEVNVAATRMLAEAAKGFRLRRFIYASSCSVYGAGEGVFDEQSAPNPVSLYARAKIDAERTLLSLNDANFHPVIVRFATVFGMSPRPRFDLVINLLTAKAVLDREITIFGGGQWRPFVHVSDAARALVIALEAPDANVKGQVFNVGSDSQNFTIDQVGDMIQAIIPEARVVKQGEGSDARNYRVSFARIRRQLGFEPRVTVQQGIREIERAVRAGQVSHYAERQYSNHRTLSEGDGLEILSDRHINELFAPARPERAVGDAAPA